MCAIPRHAVAQRSGAAGFFERRVARITIFIQESWTFACSTP
jgi:hypothetical protein